MQNTAPEYRAIFFDLDGTLLPMDMDEFMKMYFKAIGKYVGLHGADVDRFMYSLNQGIKAMAKHQDTHTNSEAFWEDFGKYMERPDLDWKEFVGEFYEVDFGKIGKDVEANPAVRRIIDKLHDKGYPLILSTMPMFPRRAIEWRTEWSGLSPDDFVRITDYENSMSIKPSYTYFAENLAACGIDANEVLMVGNNTEEDLSFMKMGADAYLITDWLLNPIDMDIDIVEHGTMDDFEKFVDALPECSDPATDIACGLIDADDVNRVLVDHGFAPMHEAEAQTSTYIEQTFGDKA
ncbi:MAG: HAD family hydrolase [Eggerthellaceae bacterium]|nr:HAD family hydrolase [Eggerthellaceae bacterium]